MNHRADAVIPRRAMSEEYTMSDTTTIEKREAPTMQAERTRTGTAFVPPVDIVEKQDELLLIADVPGARAENIDLDYERGELTITARVEPRQDPNTPYLIREYGIGDFVRSFRVGEAIDSENVTAEVNNGVLTVHLPKADQARTRKIEVRSA